MIASTAGATGTGGLPSTIGSTGMAGDSAASGSNGECENIERLPVATVPVCTLTGGDSYQTEYVGCPDSSVDVTVDSGYYYFGLKHDQSVTRCPLGVPNVRAFEDVNTRTYDWIVDTLDGQTPPVPAGVTATQFKIRMLGGVSGSRYAEADIYIFDIVDIVRKRHAWFRYGGFGLALPTPLFGSVALWGGFKEFKTSRAESLSSFVGRASLYQDLGVSVGPLSLGGTYRLTIKTAALYHNGTRIPQIPIQSGPSISVSAGAASEGTLEMASRG